jgi:hypothetical protein
MPVIHENEIFCTPNINSLQKQLTFSKISLKFIEMSEIKEALH